MISLSATSQTIALSGATYPVRHVIRRMGGVWDKTAQTWNVPHTDANMKTCEGLVSGARVDTPAPAPAPAPVPSAPVAPGSADLSAVRSMIETATRPLAQADSAHAAGLAELRRKVDEIAATRPVTLTIVRGDAPPVTLDSHAHAKLPDLIKCLAQGLHVWIAGPSGSGKTHGAEQAAKALGLTFRLQGAMTMAHELTGFVDAGGKYHETPFVTSFRSGGLILLDELDAGSNEALLALNAALANGVMCLPSGEIIRAHADFRCVGSANTFGAGATAEYVGRTRIDAAFLQRFGARITWAYDETLEVAISGNEAWAKRVQMARRKAAAAGLKVLITPRASQAGAKLIAAGYTPDAAANLTYLADLSPAQRQQVGG